MGAPVNLWILKSEYSCNNWNHKAWGMKLGKSGHSPFLPIFSLTFHHLCSYKMQTFSESHREAGEPNNHYTSSRAFHEQSDTIRQLNQILSNNTIWYLFCLNSFECLLSTLHQSGLLIITPNFPPSLVKTRYNQHNYNSVLHRQG